MDYAAAAETMMRRKLLEQVYDRMTDEERRLFVQMTMQRRSTDDILQALQSQSAQIAKLQRTQQTFGQDFLSNIAGNAAYDASIWILRRLAK